MQAFKLYCLTKVSTALREYQSLRMSISRSTMCICGESTSWEEVEEELSSLNEVNSKKPLVTSSVGEKYTVCVSCEKRYHNSCVMLIDEEEDFVCARCLIEERNEAIAKNANKRGRKKK